MTTRASLTAIVLRDLATVRREVEAYEHERDLWRPLPGLGNCGGTLVLHIAGNLQHFFGARLGGTGYVRQRDAEFARRDVPRAELLAEVDAARRAVERGMAQLTDEQLAAPFPEAIGGFTVQTGDFLSHLAGHLAFHLGQLDAHRRVVTGNPKGVAAVFVGELSTARKA